MTLNESSLNQQKDAHGTRPDKNIHTPGYTLAARNLVKVKKWSFGDDNQKNAIIHGDNLNVLKFLSDQQPSSIKCIYLDPPYNNGESYRHYDDKMEHEEWLMAIGKRLRILKSLLHSDGSIWISIDDSELHYLKVLADQVFSRKNFVGTIVWERRTTRENRRILSRSHEYILVYAKDIVRWTKTRNPLPINEEIKSRYTNPDNDPRGPWQSVSANVQDGHATPQQYYFIDAPNGKRHSPPKGRCWVYSKSKMEEEIRKGNIWFGKSGGSAPRLKKFLSERKAGITPNTLWRASEVGTTSNAKRHLLQLFDEISIFDTPKPEELLYRIFYISTQPGDLILDPYLGSGTSAAVAHKMGRSYIGVEIGEHIKTHCAYRLRKVVQGEEGGISKAVNWVGGGGFSFFRLKA